MSAVGKLFSGQSSSSDSSTSLMAQLQALQQQQQIRNMQGQQLATEASQQAAADNEAALQRRPGLGRAMLIYRGGGAKSASLGGG